MAIRGETHLLPRCVLYQAATNYITKFYMRHGISYSIDMRVVPTAVARLSSLPSKQPNEFDGEIIYAFRLIDLNPIEFYRNMCYIYGMECNEPWPLFRDSENLKQYEMDYDTLIRIVCIEMKESLEELANVYAWKCQCPECGVTDFHLIRSLWWKKNWDHIRPVEWSMEFNNKQFYYNKQEMNGTYRTWGLDTLAKCDFHPVFWSCPCNVK